jgi:hypothetical protein
MFIKTPLFLKYLMANRGGEYALDGNSIESSSQSPCARQMRVIQPECGAELVEAGEKPM